MTAAMDCHGNEQSGEQRDDRNHHETSPTHEPSLLPLQTGCGSRSEQRAAVSPLFVVVMVAVVLEHPDHPLLERV